MQKLTARPDAAEIFKEFDADGDGTINREELCYGFAKFGERLSEADIDAIMALADGDGGGGMDYREFVHMGQLTQNIQLEVSSCPAALPMDDPECSHETVQHDETCL